MGVIGEKTKFTAFGRYEYDKTAHGRFEHCVLEDHEQAWRIFVMRTIAVAQCTEGRCSHNRSPSEAVCAGGTPEP